MDKADRAPAERGSGPGLRARAAALAFVTALVTLVTQVLVHRIVTAKLLNNFAFLVISLTMLGFALSGVLLTRLLPRFLARLHEAMAGCAALFVLSLIVVTIVFYHADVGPHNPALRRSVLDFLRWVPLALLFALPFTFCGLILGTLLAAPELPTRRVYFADLVGSGVGAFAVIWSIGALGVEASLLLSCALMLASALLLAWPRSTSSRLLALLAAVAVLGCAVGREHAFDFRYPAGSMLGAARESGGRDVVEHVRWDPVAHIEVTRIPPPDPERHSYPCLIGQNHAFLSRFRRVLTQNNYAFTYAVDYDGTRDSLQGIEETIYSSAYHATSVPHPKVLVIGVGGGFDVLNALFFDAAQVTGVEINAATVGILTHTYREYFRRWVDDPRMRLVQGEGRHYLSTHPDKYDVIQLSGVDSYSGTAAAAHVFSENYLYTAEAFDLYLTRLSDDGILNVMRLEYRPPREMLKALVTATAALRRAGAHTPADHIVMLTSRERIFTALLVKRTPFTPAEVGRLSAWASRSPYFFVSAAPGSGGPPGNFYQTFLSMGSPEREAAFVAAYPFDIRPVTDDRPFFFRYSLWRHIFSKDPSVLNTGFPFMEYSLITLTSVIGLASLLCIYLPLRLLLARSARTPSAGRYAVFFAGAGLGYMAIEIALLQKFGLFLGHPNYALSVVLAALLVATGVGSLLSEAIVRRLGGPRFVAYALAFAVLAEYGLAFPLLGRLVVWPFALRVALVFALVAPLGACLGTFLPTAIERLKATTPAFVPWAWGINGIFSVLGPILGVGWSMSWGIDALLLAALPIYLVVGWSLPTLERVAVGRAA